MWWPSSDWTELNDSPPARFCFYEVKGWNVKESASGKQLERWVTSLQGLKVSSKSEGFCRGSLMASHVRVKKRRSGYSVKGRFKAIGGMEERKNTRDRICLEAMIRMEKVATKRDRWGSISGRRGVATLMECCLSQDKGEFSAGYLVGSASTVVRITGSTEITWAKRDCKGKGGSTMSAS